MLGAGFAGGILLPHLTRPGDESVDAGFARDMSRHHAQAVEMAMFAFQKGSTDDVRVIGYDIAATQQYQIGMMQTWLREWHLSPTGSSPAMAWMPDGQNALLPDGRMPGMASNDELDKLKSATGEAFDILFCQLMLRHHLGGLHMSEQAVAHAEDGEVRAAARQIRDAQAFEITQLTDKLKDLHAQPIS